MALFKSAKHLFFVLLVILIILPRLHAESGIYDRIGIISEHGRHGAVPEENIDLFTGNLTLKNLDIHLPGPNGFDLDIWRVYNSKILKDRLLGSAWGIQQEPYSWVGFGWSMHMGRLHAINTETPVIEFPDGRWETAYHNIDDYSTFITRDFAKLDKTSWKLYFKNGTVWTFGALANVQYGIMVIEQVRVVTQITNSYGHQINITYDASGSPRLKTITDSMGRTVTFITDTILGKLERINVKNATGSVVSYYYTVDEFNGDYYKLTRFAPPVLPAVTYEYGSGLASNWELLAVNTSYGGRMEYEYAEQSFYYQVYSLQTKVIHKKRIKFSSGSDFKTWTYSYPSYYNAATGTVAVAGPHFTTYATYHAYTASTPWKIGLIKEKHVADGSSSEQHEWTAKTISDTRWYVLNIDMGKAAAPLMTKTTRNRSGDSSITEEYLYERTKTGRYGLPTRINVYGAGALKNYRKLQYYFESVSSFANKYMLTYLQSEQQYDQSSAKLKETIFTYYANGAVDSIKKLKSGSTYLTWDYGYSSSNPNKITITINLPGTGGTETMVYRYGVLATLNHPGFSEFTRTISVYDSSILSETNQHGAVMGFLYDNLGRIKAVNMPSGFNDIGVSWSTNYVTITQGGNTVVKYWDGMGRDTGHVEQGDGINLYYRKTLDSEGRTVYESKGSTASADTYDYVYNNAGQIKKITDPRGKITTISITDNHKTVTDANSNATYFEYNHLPGLISKLTDPAGKKAVFSYDGAGRLLNTSYNSSRTQSYAYNALDQVTTENHPETGAITYAYSTANNLETKTWGGKSTSYTYNTSNQVLTENAGDEKITYVYDSKGRFSSITSNLGWSKTSIGYNSFGNVSQETINIPGLSAKTVSYSYDGNNQLKEITYPDGRKTIYNNNGLNMPETIAFNGSTIVNATTYGIGKQPTSVTVSANGTQYTATYNANGGITTAQLKKSSSFLFHAAYTYDGVGNITALNNSYPDLNASYTYDERNRLSGASYNPSGVGRVNNFIYNYDDYGNMTSAKENGSTVFYQDYTNKNQISDFSYDSRGNLTSNPLYNYSWDNRNRLNQLTDKLSGQSEGAYAYDEKGLRLKAVRALIPELALVAPNGGEDWMLQTIQNITWNSKNIAVNFKLELLQDGVVLGTIAENLSPGSNSYTWTVGQYSGGTAVAGSNYAVRISSMDGAITDTSDGTFSLQQAQVTVASPNGGENWQANTLHDITWTANFTGNVSIDLFKGGLLHSNIGTALAESGKIAWTVSTTLAVGADYRIKVYQGTVEDYSDNDFSITAAAAPALTVTYPNGGEFLLAGAACLVTWSSGNLSPDELINIEYSLDSGTAWLPIGQTQNTGQISWTVPASVSTTCLVKANRVLLINGPVSDSSDTVFTITSQPLQITSPIGGENWQFKKFQDITWVATGITGTIRIRLFRNGSMVGPIVDRAASRESYTWQVGAYEDPVLYAPAGSGYAIQIKTLDGTYSTMSPSTFTIFKVSSALELISPAGGEKLEPGTIHDITWSGGEEIRELKIEYSTDLGSTYQLIDAHAPNSGTYSWLVPPAASDHCLVRVSDAEGKLSSENAVIECDLAFAIKGTEGMDGAKPLLSLWLAQPMLTGEATLNAVPMLTLGCSELFDGYKLAFGEYSADLANASSLFDKNHKIRVQWDTMHGRGTVYFDQQPVLRDIPLLPLNSQSFSPCLSLRTREAVSTLRLDDFRFSLAGNEYASGGKNYTADVSPDQDDESTNASTPLLLDDFESYQTSENPASGGWSISQNVRNNAFSAEAGLVNTQYEEPALGIDSHAPLAGSKSCRITIPPGTTLTLTKSISWPERVPFAVSAKPFAIVRTAKPELGHEKDVDIHPEKDTSNQTIEEERNKNLRGPNTGIPATTTPVSGRTTLYGTTYYIHSYDGKLLAEYDSTGVCQKDYIYMGNKLLAEYQPVTGAKYYYASDQINSTRIITDSSGNVVYSAVFDPYGGLQKQWVNTYSPSLKFSGKERESKSELDYFGARYYDHMRYRFISVDPVINKEEALVNPQLWNLYAYCRNNPVTYLDPDGRADVNLANIAWKVIDKDYSVTITFGIGANNPVKDTLKIAFEASIKAAVEGGADITSIYITCTTNGEHKNKIEHPQGWALDIGLINGKNLKNGTGVESQVQALQDKFELQPNKFRNFGPKVNKKSGVAVSDKTTIKEHDSHIHWSVKQEEKQK